MGFLDFTGSTTGKVAFLDKIKVMLSEIYTTYVAEIEAARDGEVSLLAKEQAQDAATATVDGRVDTVTNEVTAARDGKASLLLKEQDQDTNITTVTDEVTAARDGQASLLAQVNYLQALIAALAAEIASEIGVPPLVENAVLSNNGLVLEWAAPASQEEMEAGSETAIRAMSPLRVAQSQAALSQAKMTDASQAEMEAGTEAGLRGMSPLRVAQAVAVRRDARTSNTILVAADRGKFIDVTSGTFTQTFTAAATLGAGWFVWYRNAGTGVITLDPDGSETIDGATTLVLNTGDNVLIICTGTAFVTMRIDTIQIDSLVTLTSGTEWTCPAGYRMAKGWFTGGGAGSTNYSGNFGGSAPGAGTAIAIFKVVPGTAYTYGIGAGGVGNAGGGNTTFTANGITYTGNGSSSPGANRYSIDGGTGSGTGAVIVQGDPGGYNSLATEPGGNTHTGFGKGAASVSSGDGTGSNGGIILELYK